MADKTDKHQAQTIVQERAHNRAAAEASGSQARRRRQLTDPALQGFGTLNEKDYRDEQRHFWKPGGSRWVDRRENGGAS